MSKRQKWAASFPSFFNQGRPFPALRNAGGWLRRGCRRLQLSGEIVGMEGDLVVGEDAEKSRLPVRES